jgi:hypothetical protein
MRLAGLDLHHLSGGRATAAVKGVHDLPLAAAQRGVGISGHMLFN